MTLKSKYVTLNWRLQFQLEKHDVSETGFASISAGGNFV
jgi:hypothetical protein